MLLFARHGQCVANAEQTFAGQGDDSPLTEMGKGQADRTGELIRERGLQVDEIITSPLGRARETAERIAKKIGLDPAKILVDPRITEYDMGKLTGTPRRNITSTELTSGEGAEDPEAFRKRVYSFLQEKSASGRNVLISSHAGVGRMMEIIRTGGKPELFYDIPELPNAAVSEIDWFRPEGGESRLRPWERRK